MHVPSSRRDAQYLADIVEAATDIAGFLEGFDRDQFVASNLLRNAVLHKLQIIGEAAAHVGLETQAVNPAIP